MKEVPASQDPDGSRCLNNQEAALTKLCTFSGHKRDVYRMAVSPDGKVIASPSEDGTVRLWKWEGAQEIRALDCHRSSISVAWSPDGDLIATTVGSEVKIWEVGTGRLLNVLSGHSSTVLNVAWSPDGAILATCSRDHTICLWDPHSGSKSTTIAAHDSQVQDLAWSRDGKRLASASWDYTARIWNAETGKLVKTFSGHTNSVRCLSWSTDERFLLTGSRDRTIKLWNVGTGAVKRVLEGHTDDVECIAFAAKGKLLLSLDRHGGLLIWRTDTWEQLLQMQCGGFTYILSNVVVHPEAPVFAVPSENMSEVDVWKIDVDALRRRGIESKSAHYVNAKVVLTGDTGVGKTGLSLVLNKQPFTATDSTPGRRVWTFGSHEVKTEAGVKQTRETLLWDLAGQPGYRVIHQLHLNEVAVALVVFDARSETDPLAGVRHWDRALRVARQRQGDSAVPMKKFLVSARNDRGGVSIGEDRLDAILKEFGFDGFFQTSAKEGWQIDELITAIEKSIDWENLPEVSSSRLFADIKSYLLDVKNAGRLLVQASQLFNEFFAKNPVPDMSERSLHGQFNACVSRLENRDLIRRLSFGGYVLLQPELLDAYASAMVNTAKEEPDGFGSISEQAALAGQFFVPEEQTVSDPEQEQLLLHATVEELVQHDLALRENADDGRYLVFPSQFNRDYEDAPDPKGKAVSITFEGPVQSIYSRLAVRLGHSGMFTTGRAEMWRNAVVFTAAVGGKCGLYLHEFAEARGRLTVFFPDDSASDETRFHFEEFILAHTKRCSLNDSVALVRFFICPDCGEPVPDAYVRMLTNRGEPAFNCPCGGMVMLTEPKERLRYPSKVRKMEGTADQQRDFNAFVVSAKGETHTRSFREWAGDERVTLAIVFTDVVGSTKLGESIRDESMNAVRRAHFDQSRELIDKFGGREIKTIGDSFMAGFKSVTSALDYALALHEDTGHSSIRIRAGIHIGSLSVEENDVFGGTVNFAARVIGAIKDDEIWLSDPAKEDVDRLGAEQHKRLSWVAHNDVEMKGFRGKFKLWSLKKSRR